MIRKPFKIDDQIIAGDYEGTVTDINMRVTRLRGYDGVSLLLPNADVFRNPLVNLTDQGKRRTSVMIGIDYRDDHNAAGPIISTAVATVDGVLIEPPPEVLLTQLGESSVDFEVRYWSAPDIKTVRHTQDRVPASSEDGRRRSRHVDPMAQACRSHGPSGPWSRACPC